MEPISKSYQPGRVAGHFQDSGRKDRALKTQLIQRISSISLSFSIFSSFYLSQFSLFQLLFFILLLYFQSRTPLVKILKADGIPVYWQKQKGNSTSTASCPGPSGNGMPYLVQASYVDEFLSHLQTHTA